MSPMKKQRVVVTYPRDEDPAVTRVRVKSKEKYNKKWKFYVAELQCGVATFEMGCDWIASRNSSSVLNNGFRREGPQAQHVPSTSRATKRPAPTLPELPREKRSRRGFASEPVPSTSSHRHYSTPECSSEHPRDDRINRTQRDAARPSHNESIAQRTDMRFHWHKPQQDQEPDIDGNENQSRSPSPNEVSIDTQAKILQEQIKNEASRADKATQKTVLQQQMLNQFATLMKQMGVTLKNSCTMYNELRSSLIECARTYKVLLRLVDRLNAGTAGYLTVPDLAPEVLQSVQPTQTREAPPRKKHNNLWRFVLPPEYDRHNSRWTLKYQKRIPGLIELSPDSGIYVSSAALELCTISSQDCTRLALQLLKEVFSRNALSVCASMSERAQATNRIGSDVRPGLDEYATTVLLNFVIDFGRERSWDTDLEPILTALHVKIQRMRFKYGVMVKC